MLGASSALLFAPPQPPLALDSEREIVIGRSQSCDLTLPSRQASRRHAAVRREGDRYVLRDLGSTNHTFVNGARIGGERILEPGDRIEIGEVTVTFCKIDPAMAEVMNAPGEAQTIIAERPLVSAPEALRGDLGQVPIFAVLQMLDLGSKSGVLEISSDDGVAHMWLEDGRPAHAETEKQSGFDAAIAIVGTQSGSFSFESGPEAVQRTIDASVTELLLQGSRLADEDRRGPAAG